MRELYILLFGAEGENIYSTNVNGVEWYYAAHICKLIGIKDVSSAMRDRWDFFELLDEDKCKLRDNNVNRHSDVWFISESGFWKLMALGEGVKVLLFRAWVATEFLPTILHVLVDGSGVAERGYRRLLRY